MERGKLVFHISYPSMQKEIRAFVQTDNNSNNIYIRIEDNFNVVDIFKMIIWQGGGNKRIYIHDRFKTFTQIGYINIINSEVDSLNIVENYKVESVIGYIFRLVYMFFFDKDKWTFTDKLPIYINLEKIEIPTIQVKYIKGYTEMMKIILNKFKDLLRFGMEKQPLKPISDVSKKTNKTVENIIPKNVPKTTDTKTNEFVYTAHVGCRDCKYRKECIRKSKVNGKCSDYVKGAAVGDYTQWS